ncbi:type 1 glutamine amidotransferase [Halovulum sp. GXIMD14793]
MQIGILKTGNAVAQLANSHGEYPDMFRRMLSAVDPTLEFHTVDVVGGDELGDPACMDGWVITGSRHGIYDDLPWIEPLKAFLRRALDEGVPVAGICFGHQILAEAMGGKAAKSEKGWGLGPHQYEAVSVPEWMSGLSAGWSAHAVHQDQVIAQPPNTTVLARSEFCNYAALAYGDPDNPLAISVQPHPEFDAPFVHGLIDTRLHEVVPADVLEDASSKLGTPVNNADWANTIVTFFRKAAG